MTSIGSNIRMKVIGIFMASSLLVQSNYACWAANDISDSANANSANASSQVPPLEMAPAALPTASEVAAWNKSDASEKVSVDAANGLEVAPESLPTAKDVSSSTAIPLVASAITPAINTESSSIPLATQTPILDTLMDKDTIADATTIADQPLLKGGVTSEPTVAEQQVGDLTRQILLKEIELERFNLHYTMEVAKQGRWKGWRYGMLQEVNSGMGLTGAIIGVAERGSHIHSPEKVHTEFQESACYIPMIGAIIGASAAALEFGINEYHDYQARTKGFSPKAARDHVRGLRDDINNLLAQRDALLKVEASSPALVGHAEIDDCEGKVLRDLRDQNLQEFERFHIGARKLFAFQQMQYFFDLTKYTTNAIGFDFAYLSLHRHRRVWNGRAGVLFIVSGVLYMGGPIASRLWAKGVGEAHRHWLRPTTQDAENATFDTLQKDHAMLDTLCKEGKVAPDKLEAPVQRSAIYGVEEKSFQDDLRRSQKSRDQAKLSATQNIGSGLYVGGSKLASGILFAIPGYDHNFNGKTFRSAHVTNSCLFASSVIAIPAGGYAMLDTLRINVKGEMNRHKLMKEGMHPAQLTHARLAQLDDMESKLKAGK